MENTQGYDLKKALVSLNFQFNHSTSVNRTVCIEVKGNLAQSFYM